MLLDNVVLEETRSCAERCAMQNEFTIVMPLQPVGFEIFRQKLKNHTFLTGTGYFKHFRICQMIIRQNCETDRSNSVVRLSAFQDKHLRTSMFKARVFPNNKNMSRII